MKFSKDLAQNIVVEWKDKYIDYKQLKSRIQDIKQKALTLAQAYATIKEIANLSIEATIDLQKIKECGMFWTMLEEEVQKVNKFYQEQISEMLKQFHELVRLCIAVGLIEEFVPHEKKFSSRLQRELGRLQQSDRIKFSSGEVIEESTDVTFPLHHMRSKSNISANDAQIDVSIPIETEEVTTINLQKNSNKTKYKLRQSLCEFYRGLILLQSFCELNYDALRKILKKYDKNFGTQMQHQYLVTTIQNLEFYKHSHLKLLIAEVEHVFALSFTSGHRTQAMEKLRVPESQSSELSFLGLGWNVGLSFPILLLICYTLSIFDHTIFPRFDSVIICYRMLAMLILMTWCWGVDMYFWTKYRVNYVFIFGFNARQHKRYPYILGAASIFTVVWLFSLSFYIIGATQPRGFGWVGKIPFALHPLILIFISLVLFIQFQINSKWWLLRTVFKIVTAPFHKIQFQDFFVGDQLVSIAIVLYDFEYSLCFLLYDAWMDTDICTKANTWTRPLIASLPSIWRFLQALRRYRDTNDTRHLWNSGKYFTAICVAICSTLRANVSDKFLSLWLVAIITSTLYANYWDIFQDWGLGNTENKYLRPKLLYAYPTVYYTAIATNFAMRLMWTLTISPDSLHLIGDPFILPLVLACVEIIRRAQWNIFRLENEQLNNVGKFRAFNVVVPPVDQLSISGNLDSAQATISEKMNLNQM
mmetsp:Transcript_17783/g.24763  ORF Transcript_17783/g.24763 Transcript_17783/m.24763 type:complete len:701 (-) Transcript_17783:238-2340(-)